MTKINQIQTAILSLGAGAYQKMMEEYLLRRFKFPNISPLGSHDGTDKTTQGTPDAFVRCEDGKFILIEYGTVGKNAYDKVQKDILDCLSFEKTGIRTSDIKRIIVCHTSTNFNAGQVDQLYSHFEGIELIGLGDVSNDLYHKYPGIAKDHLSIELDTNQILDLEEFIRHNDRNAYSTSLDMPLLCREEALETIGDLLSKNDVITISGASGIGKTRLAVEACNRLLLLKNYQFKIVKNNGERIYNDLKTIFTDDANYLVLVDDADQLVQLNHLLDICVDDRRKHKMKIIITVRDYAKEKLMRDVEKIIRSATFELAPLSDQSIEQILKENMGITNHRVTERIKQVVKGNVRLAIMAAMCAKRGQTEMLQNTFQIFDNYYSQVVEEIDREEMTTAGIVAFFDAFKLDEKELPLQIAIENGVNFHDFRKHCHRLHQMEAVDIHETSAVKFSNQNLRDYILYLVFVKERRIRISSIIRCGFPRYKRQIITALNTVLNLFITDESLQYIEQEVKTAWSVVKGDKLEVIKEFVGAFHVLMPDETLSFINQEIDKLPICEVCLTAQDFEDSGKAEQIHSDLLKILVKFKHTECFEDALELIMHKLEKNFEKAKDIYLIFNKHLGIDRHSHKSMYDNEIMLLEKLLDYDKSENTTLSSFCLLFAIENILRYDFSSSESEQHMMVQFYQFGLSACDKLFVLRKLAFQGLARLYSKDDFKKQVVASLLKYHVSKRTVEYKTVFECDMSLFAEHFGELVDTKSWNICKILDHFNDFCMRFNVPYSNLLPSFEENKTYMLYHSLKKEHIFEPQSYESTLEKRKEKISILAKTCSVEDFTLLCSELKRDFTLTKRHNTFDVSTGIDILFSSLLEFDSDLFTEWCKIYIQHDAPCCGNNSKKFPELLILAVGVRNAIIFVEALDFTDKNIWLGHLYNSVPCEELTSKDCEKMLSLLENSELVLPKTVVNANAIHEGFFIKYVQKLYELSEENPYLMSIFLEHFGAYSEKDAQYALSCFGQNKELLTNSYIRAMYGKVHFDAWGNLFISIVHTDETFLPRCIRTFLELHSYDSYIEPMEKLWEQENYMQLVTASMETLREAPKYFYTINSIGESMLKADKKDKHKCEQKDNWIKNYILKYSKDKNRMEFLFGIVCNLSYERCTEITHYFCIQNDCFEDFSELPITRTHNSWSGSEVPTIERKIAYLEGLKDVLKGARFIKHREDLSHHIQKQREYMEAVLLKEFTEVY